MTIIYIVDTSSWIDLSHNYPHYNFVGLWSNLENLITNDRIKTPRQVKNEIMAGKDEDLTNWCRRNKSMFVDDVQVTVVAHNITQEHPELVNPDKSNEEADPFLIALARFLNGKDDSNAIIVTQESTRSRIKIPHIASVYGVDSISLVGLITQEGWRF